MQDIFVGRQPIYNRNLGIYAYEMLFHDGCENSAGEEPSEDRASSQEIINTFVDMGLSNLVGNSLANITLTEHFLIRRNALPFPGERVILDIHPNIPINEHTLNTLRKFKNSGFTLALNNYHEISDFSELFEIADIFKLDIQYTTKKEAQSYIKRLKKHGLKILAKKVETLEEYESYMDMDFDYFQGFFLSNPRILKSKTLETSKLSAMQLLSTLCNSDSDTASIEQAISSDLTLSYKLLKLMNSAFFHLPDEIDSIKRAVVFLGRRKLTYWASMLALSNMNNRPLELVKIAMVRAKTCELIAKKLELKDTEQFFTAGMFSALDILMERPINSLITPLPLADEIKAGIVHHKGNIGVLVKCSRLLETSAAKKLSIKGITKAELSALYFQADNWAQKVTQSIK